jgi:hypothetical protein
MNKGIYRNRQSMINTDVHYVCYFSILGARGGAVVEALHYKP